MKRLIQAFTRLIMRREQARPSKLFLEALREYIDNHVTQNQLSPSTRSKYDNFYDNISRFFIARRLKEIKCEELRVPLFEELRRHLHATLKSCGITHSSRHLELCIAAVDFAVRNEYLKYNPILSLETRRDRTKPVVNPDADELARFVNYNFANSGFQKAQVLYTFQSATGLSYGNLYDYKTVVDPETGGLWIEDNRKKIGEKPFFVPLDAPGFEIAKTLHDLYQGELPRLTNGTYNRYLKEMAEILQIKKRLTTHTARKAFATLMDQKDFSLGVISSILGNSEQVCRTHYINPSKKKIERAVQRHNNEQLVRSVLSN